MKVMIYYPCSSRVKGNTVFFSRDDQNSLERKIADLSGTNAGNEEFKHVPNHSCYQIEDEVGKIRYIQFTDSNVIVGDEIIVGPYVYLLPLKNSLKRDVNL
jgi:hypothetical protein